MKKVLCLIATVLLFNACCNQKKENMETSKDVFSKGALMPSNPNFTGDAWLEMFVTAADSMDCTVANVTFAPGVRNSWHSHPGGQILLATSGKGYYQEKDQPIRLLMPGDVVKIASDVIHWHGAAPDSEFTHIAIGTQPSKGPVVWLEPVTDAQYGTYKEVNKETNKVRLSRIVVDSTQLDEYNAYLKEEIEVSMRSESGVLTLYATSEKEHPNRITILEVYADEQAYQSHIKTPHFLKYKQGTLNMVQQLELIDTNPLIEGLKIK